MKVKNSQLVRRLALALNTQRRKSIYLCFYLSSFQFENCFYLLLPTLIMDDINWDIVGVSNVNASIVEANVIESVQNIKEQELKQKLLALDRSIEDLNSELRQVEKFC